MSRMFVAVVPLCLMFAGCARSGGPGSDSMAGTAVNGRVCRYHAIDEQVSFVLVFDTRDSELPIKDARLHLATNGGLKEDFRTLEERSFSIRFEPGRPLAINEHEYDLGKGRVFLVPLAREKSLCEQLPVPLPPRAGSHPDERYVREELLKAAASTPQLAAFLGIENH